MGEATDHPEGCSELQEVVPPIDRVAEMRDIREFERIGLSAETLIELAR